MQLIAKGFLKDILQTLPSLSIREPEEYMLLGPVGTQFLSGDLYCALFLLPDNADEDITQIVDGHHLEIIYDLLTILDVIEDTRLEHPNADTDYLLQALDYFMQNDAYL